MVLNKSLLYGTNGKVRNCNCNNEFQIKEKKRLIHYSIHSEVIQTVLSNKLMLILKEMSMKNYSIYNPKNIKKQFKYH